MSTSALYQLADRALGGGLAERLQLWANAGISRRSAAMILAEELGVAIHPTTVESWMREAAPR